VFLYATNQIDLLEIRQKTGSSTFDRVAQITYNASHLPLTYIDAAGQMTQLSYNSRGQLLSLVDGSGNAHTNVYDSNGYLISMDGPVPGPSDSMSFTYDGFGRVRTVTDADGYTVTRDYDALDRPTVITYPDGTFEQFTYDRLDRASERDRLGRSMT